MPTACTWVPTVRPPAAKRAQLARCSDRTQRDWFETARFQRSSRAGRSGHQASSCPSQNCTPLAASNVASTVPVVRSTTVKRSGATDQAWGCAHAHPVGPAHRSTLQSTNRPQVHDRVLRERVLEARWEDDREGLDFIPPKRSNACYPDTERSISSTRRSSARCAALRAASDEGFPVHAASSS